MFRALLAIKCWLSSGRLPWLLLLEGGALLQILLFWIFGHGEGDSGLGQGDSGRTAPEFSLLASREYMKATSVFRTY